MSHLFTDEWAADLGIESILLPVEGYPAEITPLEVALYLAECSGGELTLFHVKEESVEKRRSFGILKNRFLELAGKLKIKYKVREESGLEPSQAILKVEDKYDIVVMGASRRLRERLFGDTASKVIRTASKPVIVITSPIRMWDENKEPLRQILVPLRNIEVDKGALKLAVALTSSATSKDFSITVLNVITLPQSTPLTRSIDGFFTTEEKIFLKKVGDLIPLVTRPLNPQVVLGRDIGTSIVSYAEETKADLIILGEKEKPGPLRRLIGTKAHYISQHAPCGVVMIFKPK